MKGNFLGLEKRVWELITRGRKEPTQEILFRRR